MFTTTAHKYGRKQHFLENLQPNWTNNKHLDLLFLARQTTYVLKLIFGATTGSRSTSEANTFENATCHTVLPCFVFTPSSKSSNGIHKHHRPIHSYIRNLRTQRELSKITHTHNTRWNHNEAFFFLAWMNSQSKDRRRKTMHVRLLIARLNHLVLWACWVRHAARV